MNFCIKLTLFVLKIYEKNSSECLRFEIIVMAFRVRKLSRNGPKGESRERVEGVDLPPYYKKLKMPEMQS